MPVEQIQQRLSRIAAADLSGKQYYAVALTTTPGQINLAGLGAAALGILLDKPTSGRVGAVCVSGRTSAIYGAGVTAGDPITPDANGKIITATGTNIIMGYALTTGVLNDIGDVFLR